MAIADRWSVVFTNDNVEATNYQMFGIETLPPGVGDYQKVCAQIIGYAAVAAAAMATGTRIEEVRHIPAGDNMSIPFPFPQDEYDALEALSGGDMAPMTGYGDTLVGAGQALAPLGTSIVLSEYSNVGGPAGRGRHFLPFISDASVDSGGLVSTVIRTKIHAAYEALLLNPNQYAYASVAIEVNPVILNAAGTATKTIVTAKCQPIFSNLESRRR